MEIIANTPQTKPTVAQPLSYHKLVRDYDVQDDSAVNIQPWAFRAEAGMSLYSYLVSKTSARNLARSSAPNSCHARDADIS